MPPLKAQQTELSEKLVERLVVERDLTDSRELDFELEDGSLLSFTITTITNEQKNAIKKRYDPQFPAPPLETYDTPLGSIVRFDLTDQDYKLKIKAWEQKMSRAVLADSLGISEDQAQALESTLTFPQYTKLRSAVELINGVHSEPMADLVKDAMWAPEVSTWLQTYKPKIDSIKITDTILFKEMECVIAAGMTLRQWDQCSPRERMLYLEWFAFKNAKEAYINWWTYERSKEKGIV